MTDKEKIIAYIDKLLEKYPKNYYLLMVAEFIDSLQEEPKPKKCMYTNEYYTDEDRKVLCEDCEEDCEFNQKSSTPKEINFEQELYKVFGQVKDFTLGMQIAKWFYDMGKNSQEPVGEELITELKSIVNIRELARQGIPVVKIARHIANWQKNQMIKNAIEAIVKVDAGGYPYIPQMELYDYDKDIPLAKEGDKYKVVLIKED